MKQLTDIIQLNETVAYQVYISHTIRSQPVRLAQPDITQRASRVILDMMTLMNACLKFNLSGYILYFQVCITCQLGCHDL